MGTKLESYIIKLGKRVDKVNGLHKVLWHVTSPGTNPNATEGRIKREDWDRFLGVLKNSFKNRYWLNWELYAKPNGTQPVFEYSCDVNDFKYVINDFITRELNGHTVFDNFDYSREDNFFDIHPDIATSYDPTLGQPYL